ncbi:MAG: serine/threonine protein phosphatase [Clostridiales bacterium]|nr:serine/threonine protein phosphatase [Clostridiales bacterium]
MGLFNFKKNKSSSVQAVTSVQTSSVSSHPYQNLSSYFPMGIQERIYAQLREAVPILDVAVDKIVRLTEGFSFETGNDSLNEQMNAYFADINVGGNQRGINSFISNYLNQLLTFGTAIGEIVMDENGIYALYNSELADLELKRSQNGIDVEFYNSGIAVKYPQLILYSVLNPQPGELCGTSLLRGLPFISDILMKIYNTIGQNWEHAGNLRYAVICKPDDSAGYDAAERANSVASAWKDAMDSKSVKDFIAVGDVSVKVIGSDNLMLDSEIPVKQLLEQIVAKTSLPPFMLGLSWSSTERMSTQQADILTTELESYRRILTPVIMKIGNMYLSLNGYSENAGVVWNDITLQDECDHAKAQLYTAQAEKIRKELA